MAHIEFTGAGALSYNYEFDTDGDLKTFLRAFSESASSGSTGGIWLTGEDALIWLPTNTPLSARFDDEDLADADMVELLHGRVVSLDEAVE